MSCFTLRQGDVIAKLTQVCYRPDEGFHEQGTPHVDEAYISAESDTKLAGGPAIIQHDGKEFPITISVFLEPPAEGDDEEEDDEWKNPVCEIELGYAEGVKELAKFLGLL